MTAEPWRVGEHYGIHVYEGDRPVATFHRPEDAMRAVMIYNSVVAPAEITEEIAEEARQLDARLP